MSDRRRRQLERELRAEGDDCQVVPRGLVGDTVKLLERSALALHVAIRSEGIPVGLDQIAFQRHRRNRLTATETAIKAWKR